MFERELAFFVANQDKLVAKHAGRVLVIRGEEVVGVFEDALAAYSTARARFAQGEFMLQVCEPGADAYTVTLA